MRLVLTSYLPLQLPCCSVCNSYHVLQSVEQLAFADVVVINKTDLVTASEKTELEKRVKVITLPTPVLHCIAYPCPCDILQQVGSCSCKPSVQVTLASSVIKPG